MKYLYILLSTLLVFCTHKVLSQAVGDCVFLQGAFVEIGIAPNGGYGSTLPAPAGYHPFLGATAFPFTFWDPGAGTSTSGVNFLGFVADYGADGWTVGTPPYFGDFYLPGTPQEGWAIRIGGITGTEGHAYIPNYLTTPTPGYTDEYGAITLALSGTNVGYSNSGGVIKGVWQGNFNALAIRQTTILDTNKLYFTVNVVITNTGATPIDSIYYLRTVDPDNDETRTGDFTTINTITYQLPDPSNRVLVSATGTTYTNAYLGLGTKDCRAKAVVFDSGRYTRFGPLAPSYSLDSIYNQTSPFYKFGLGFTVVDDIGIGLDFNIGTIAAGDSTSISYAYILNATYIDSALNSTQPTLMVNDTAISGGTETINLCDYRPATIDVTIANGGFYQWRWSPTSFLAGPTGPSNTISSSGISSNITYTVTGTNTAGGCDSIIFYVNLTHTTFPGPTVNPVSYCQDAAASPLSPSGIAYTWWTTPVGGIGTTTAPTPSTATPGTTIYYVSDTFGLCVSLRSPDTVTIIPLPLPPTLADPNPYCQGQAFIPITAVGTSILWYADRNGGIGSTTAPTVNTGIPGVDSFYASQTVNGCEGPRGAIGIMVLDSIIPSFTYDIHFGCKGDTVTFTNSTTGAARYEWNFGDGIGDTDLNPVHIYKLQDTFAAELVAINGICEKRDTENIPLVHPLHAAFDFTPQIVCQKNPVIFTDSSIGTGISYAWSLGNGATDTAVNTSQVYDVAGVYHIRLIVTDFVPCHDTASATLYVDSTSAISMGVTDSVICRGGEITFVGNYTSIGNTGVTWNFGDGDSVTNVNPVSYSYPVVGTYPVTVTAHYRVCKDTSVTRQFSIFATPVINLGVDTTICPGGDPVVIADMGNNPVTAHWVWSTGETSSAITIVAPGYYWATVTIDGCSSSDSVWVKNDCYMDIPNVFTPNGDGMNDYFFPRQFLTKGLISFSMNIYNRWGQTVFETTSLEGSGWDGKFNNVAQPEGVYIYIIDARFKDGQKEHHQGNVTLLR